MNLKWPSSRSEIERIQRERKRISVERALQSAFLRKRMPKLDLERLDDPDVWRRIPLLTKEQLREIPPERFHEEFCIQPRTKVVEYWRSGGATGRPLFYPRSAEDMVHGLGAFERAWALIGATADDCAHISFPLGVHPVAHLYARAAINLGIGTIWCGAGNNTPSEVQLELIDQLKPTVWLGMASYGLHLANLAEVKGFDLNKSTVKKIIVAAEPLSPVKRQKLERGWGAEVFDHFGMTEAAFVAGEGVGHHGLHIWADLFFLEVVDEKSGDPVPEGEVGSLVVTPLWNNHMTPFLRWSSGDLVSMTSQGAGDGPWSVFPLLKHARRTIGFFKVRGVNINHAELEDAMFRDAEVVDFRAEVYNEGDNDVLHLLVETRASEERVSDTIHKAFGVKPRVTPLARGTIAKEFEANIKAPRFVDRRG